MRESQLSFQSRYASQTSTYSGVMRTRIESETAAEATQRNPSMTAQAELGERISALQEVRFQSKTGVAEGDDEEQSLSQVEFRFSKLVSLLERMFGIKIDVFDEREIQDPGKADAQGETSEPAARGRPGRQVIEAIQEYRVVTESESSSVSIQGKLALNDGRQLDVDLSLDMSRTRSEEYWGTMTLSSRTVDPLVVNLNGNAAQLTNQRMAFDIDADGKEDQVAFATGNSAFLALDKNKNGTIDNGNELFGPKSGSGFADLAKYDDNKDGLIDSLDDIWEELLLVQRDESGNETLLSLKDVGISAFVLERTSSPFSLFNDKGEQTGVIRETGLDVRDDNTVDTLQHVDLVV